MPKRKEPELDPKEQFKRFKETAKELEVDGVGLDDAFKKLAVKKAGPAPSKPETKTR